MTDHREISISQIAGIEKFSSQFSSFGSDYVFAHLTPTHQIADLGDTPMRVSGLSTFICRNGSVDLDINLTPYHLEAGSLLVIGSDSVVSVRKYDPSTIDAYLFIISPEFIRDINLDLNILNTVRFTPSHNPVMNLSQEEMNLMCRYLDLIHFNTIDNTDALYVRSIARCLIAASVYQMLQFVRERSKEMDSVETGSRRANYVRDFMQLVHTHHRHERGVAFYASKLYISPKYLSLIIKESTGRSAAEWIDEFVILEAKNLLRFSGKNVQQVAYDLNFTNQSSFGKYFKHLTGMSPTEFMKK